MKIYKKLSFYLTVFILLVTLTLTIEVEKPTANRMIMTGLATATYIEPPTYDYVRLPTTFVTEEFMERTGFNPGDVRNENWIFGYLPHGTQLTVDEQAAIEILDEDLLRHNLFDRETLEVIPTQELSQAMMETTTLAVQESYHTYEDLYFQMKTWANDNPKMQMYIAGNAWVNIACPDGDHPIVGSDCRRQLWFMRISTTPSVTSNKPMMIMTANIHGDEVMGREMIIRLIDLFDLVSTNGATWCKQNGCADADEATIDMVDHLLANAEILLMPSLNPDGNFYNKRQNCNKASSTDHNICYSGLDLNRDFPQPERADVDSSSGRALETKHVIDKLFKLKPETYDGSQVELAHPFLTSVSYHSGGRFINMPYADCTNAGGSTTSGCAANYPNNGGIFPEDLHVKSMNREYANLNNWIYTSSRGVNGLNYGYDMYLPLSGTSKDWIAVYRDSYDTVPELTSTKHPSFNANNEGVPDQWEYNRKSMVTWLYRSTKGFHLEIKDNVGQPVYGTTVKSNNRRLTYGDTNFIHRLGGRTVDPELMGYGTPELNYMGGAPVDTTGFFQVTIEKSGYEAEVLSLTPEYFNGTFTQVTLTPEGGVVCPNNVREGAEVCDGTDLAGETCQSLKFDSGTLDCLGDCSGFDTSACEQSTDQSFGVTNVGSSTSTNNKLRAMPFTMPEDGTIQSVTMYHTGGSGSMRLGVYSGEGSSATLLSQSAETTISGTTGWQEIALQTPVFVFGGQTVMLAWYYSNNPGIRYVTGSSGRWQRSLTWSGDGSMPDPFGSSSQSNYIYSIYATYNP